MRLLLSILSSLLLFPGISFALDKTEIRDIIEQAHPGAEISEIEKETYRGEKIWEVDFRHEDRKLEAIISLDGEIIKVQIDD